jgi:Alcohol dehydrogenase GroES-like domain
VRGIHGASNIVGYGEEAHMKAVRIHTLGGPEVLRYEDVPDPWAGAGEVLIKVAAAGINYADLGRRKGTYARHITLPAILGSGSGGHCGADRPQTGLRELFSTRSTFTPRRSLR